jgi:5'-phosphate synthase pdxT subunit
LTDLEGLVLPGGESTAMGLIGTASTAADGTTLWEALRAYSQRMPTWGTCAGMILLAEKCVGSSAVIQQGQALIGGVDITVCRNYFGSQISSFEMPTPPPPTKGSDNDNSANHNFPGVFIRAPAILAVGADVTVLGRVHATPCRQAAVTLAALEDKIARGESVLSKQQQHFGVVDALERTNGSGRLEYKVVVDTQPKEDEIADGTVVRLPGAAPGTAARHVICAARKDQLLCTAFHPELTDDYRWHEYFVNEMVKKKA